MKKELVGLKGLQGVVIGITLVRNRLCGNVNGFAPVRQASEWPPLKSEKLIGKLVNSHKTARHSLGCSWVLYDKLNFEYLSPDSQSIYLFILLFYQRLCRWVQATAHYRLGGWPDAAPSIPYN